MVEILISELTSKLATVVDVFEIRKKRRHSVEILNMLATEPQGQRERKSNDTHNVILWKGKKVGTNRRSRRIIRGIIRACLQPT